MSYIFEWDNGNSSKSLEKHGISNLEAETVFADPNRYISVDYKHSVAEERYVCIAKSELERLLFVVFTKRGQYTRIISQSSRREIM